MVFQNILNYIVYDNPISKATVSMFSTNKNMSPPISIIMEKVPLWKLAAETGPFVRIAAIMGATGVILGAYGAHRKYPKDTPQDLKAIFETANRFHFFHTLALFGVPMCRNPKVAGTLLVTGTILFSGTCYYKAFTGEDTLSKLTPIGGTILIFGWLSMVL